jgi:hypothetical protein
MEGGVRGYGSWQMPPQPHPLEQQSQTSWGGSAHTYRKVSLMAARSRGSSVVALWGFPEMLASAARLSWRRAFCTSGFLASSKSVINKGTAVCRGHGEKAQTWALSRALSTGMSIPGGCISQGLGTYMPRAGPSLGPRPNVHLCVA